MTRPSLGRTGSLLRAVILALATAFVTMSWAAPGAPDVGSGVAWGVVPAPGDDVTVALERTSYGALTTIHAFSGEPNIGVAPDGTTYVTGIGWDGSAGGTMVFRRLPGQSSFTYLGMPNRGYGGNDEALAIGPTGTVWISGMYGFWTPQGACASMTSSSDRGAMWSPTTGGVCAGFGIDRQWIAVDGHDRPWIVMHEICCSGQHTAYRSLDGGLTFELASVTSVMSGFPGNVFADRANGRIYEATNCGQLLARGPCVLIGTTDPVSPAWVPSPVTVYTQHPGGLAHVAGAVDDAGNVYVTFVDKRAGDPRFSVYLSRSSDGGLTWSAPARVSEASKLTTMPWVAAGADGNVAVVWYETSSSGLFPSGVGTSAAWHVMSATIRGWTGVPMPAPELAQLSTTPAKTGPICTSGASCTGHRELLDFFEAAVGPDGKLHVVWPQVGTWTMRVADVDAQLR